MVSVDWVPLCFADCYVLDVCRVFPLPGLTGLPSLLIVLAIIESFNQSVGQIVMRSPGLKSVGGRKARLGS